MVAVGASSPCSGQPAFGRDGREMQGGQQGPVWFIAGTLGSGDLTERYCEVPDGKAIFFPVINVAWLGFLSDPEEQRTADFVRQTAEDSCSRDTIEGLSVTIDGVVVSNPVQYATSGEQSPIFQVQLPTDNIFGATDDWLPELMLSPSAHQGFYIYVKPLAPGDHTIEWTATWDCGSQNVKYHVYVLEGVTGEVQ